MLSQRDRLLLDDVTRRLYTVRSGKEFEEVLSSLGKIVRFEFSGCGVVNLVSQGFEVVTMNYPRSFVEIYMAQGFSTEPAICQLVQNDLEFASSEGLKDLDRGEIDKLKLQCGIYSCLSVAIRGEANFAFYVAMSNFHPQSRRKLLSVLEMIGGQLQRAGMRVVELRRAASTVQPGGVSIGELITRVQGQMKGWSEREREIVRLLCTAKTNGEIALELGITERTVRFHIENLKARYGSHPREWDVSILAAVEKALDLSGCLVRESVSA